MTALDYVRRLFAHMEWADRRVLELLARAGGDAPEPAVRTFAHVLGAERVWMLRLHGEDSRAQPTWPVLSMEELHALAAANRAEYARYLEGLRETDLTSILAYTNQQGQPFRTAVGDILLHVALHGAYHRGQVARMVREAGGEPVNTDFVTYVRELAE
ncbi:MAG: DinB family protein [Gemmatimonadetes bacterium]|nr:DinB family protein [Gemmatimonadota bacterium]